MEERLPVPFFPTSSLPLLARMAIVSYGAAQITIGGSIFFIYVLQQLGIITRP
jgi:hypothetical protein